jgi:hypothetical protein
VHAVPGWWVSFVPTANLGAIVLLQGTVERGLDDATKPLSTLLTSRGPMTLADDERSPGKESAGFPHSVTG